MGVGLVGSCGQEYQTQFGKKPGDLAQNWDFSVDHVTLWPTCTFESHKDHGVFVPLVLMQLRSNF